MLRSKRQFKVSVLWTVALFISITAAVEAAIVLENQTARYEIGAHGENLRLIDKQSGADYCDRETAPVCAHVSIGEKKQDVTSVSYDGRQLQMRFGDTGVRASVRVKTEKDFFLFEVADVEGDGIDSLTFMDLAVKPHPSFAVCTLALNLQTNVPEIPQPNIRNHAMCYPRFGMTGAEAALLAVPQNALRATMKKVVSQAEAIPPSSIGGPWALDAEINRGSYLFNFGDMSEETVDEWIALAKTVGINQIDFHGGTSFRFGDCEPNPETYPEGRKSLKAVIDRLHDAGIYAGLHTYAFFIDKKCPWVTPVPDPRLAKDAAFCLAAELTADATCVPVVESTEKMSTITGFFVRNSVTLHIDDELIIYRDIQKTDPYAFTNCERGAYGTKASPHSKDAPVHHLKECFGLFVPDGDSTMLAEVAAKTAQTFNECGFDMMYLDALDGEDILGGSENGWHYGSKFVFELCHRVNKPALMEMSTFRHHLWYVRSRMGAWDHPTRGHKRYIDIHCQANEALKRMFLPGHLGWWAVKNWNGIQGEPTFTDDMEYLGCKCIGTDVGFSIMGIDPENVSGPVYQRLAGIMKRYEDLRHTGTVDEAVKEKLREPGKDFTLVQEADGEMRFYRMHYDKHKVEGLHNGTNRWMAHNPYRAQPLKIRLEVLTSAAPYDATDSVTLMDFAPENPLEERAAAQGLQLELQSSTEKVKVGKFSGRLVVTNSAQEDAKGAWAMAGTTFSPTIDIEDKGALGVWIHGDGQGELLNIQLLNPTHLTHKGSGEHYVKVDFTGWKYFELIEVESERHYDYRWPYGGTYSVFREIVELGHTEKLNVWCNDVPLQKEVECWIGPIKALPLVDITIENPTLTVGNQKIVFPVELQTGQYLEFYSLEDCKLYGKKGELLGEIRPRGGVPRLLQGENPITFTCDGPADVNARARVTVMSRGEAL
ncbi:MAG: hypothetical protein ABIH23_22790 [bacterium]